MPRKSPIKKKEQPQRNSVPTFQKVKKIRKHQKFGTSKLEQDFARDFLEKLGVEYEWQFEAKEIGRFYDYFIPSKRILIEIDGDI